MMLKRTSLAIIVVAQALVAQAPQRPRFADSSAQAIMAHAGAHVSRSVLQPLLRQQIGAVDPAKLDEVADSLTARILLRRSGVRDSAVLENAIWALNALIEASVERRGTDRPYDGGRSRLERIYAESNDNAVRMRALESMLSLPNRRQGYAFLKSVAESHDATAWVAIMALVADIRGLELGAPITEAQKDSSRSVLDELAQSGRVTEPGAARDLSMWMQTKNWKPPQ